MGSGGWFVFLIQIGKAQGLHESSSLLSSKLGELTVCVLVVEVWLTKEHICINLNLYYLRVLQTVVNTQ
jgi:hypothetical protein